MPKTAIPGTVPALKQTVSKITTKILDKLPFDLYAVDTCVKNQLHWHDYTQIWYTVSGSYYHTINGVCKLQTPGSVALIYPYTLHAVDTSHTRLEEARIISISICNDAYAKNQLPLIPLTYSLASFDSFSLSPFIMLSGHDKELADDLCERALSEFSKNQAMIYGKIFSCINSLLELCASAINNRLGKRDIHIAHERALHISNAVYYITENASSKIPLAKVSRSAMMSERSFTDKFKLTVGQTYHSYLVSVRMAKAVDLLRYTNKSIAEISDECGFSNNGHFTNVCTELFSMSPLALRRYFREWAKKHGQRMYEKSLNASWLYNWSEDELAEIKRLECGEI